MKIQIGTTFKTYTHKAKITANTTTNFGSVQPIFSRKLHAGDSISLNIGQFVRLMPMPYPTLGEVNLKTKGVFVPIGDIALPYDNYLSQTNYYFQGSNAIPKNLPTLSMASLVTYILNQSRYAFSKSFQYSPAEPSANISKSDLVANTDEVHSDLLKSMNHNIGLKANDGIFDLTSVKKNANIKFSSNDVNPLNADFLTFVNSDGSIASFTSSSTSESGSASSVICYRLTQDGYYITRVLRALGYSLNSNDETAVNVLPIFAYAKALYDTFSIQRDSQYTDSDLYKNIKLLGENMLCWTTHNYQTTLGLVVNTLSFICDNSYCSLPTDFVSAHLTSPYGLGSSREVFPSNTNVLPYTDDEGKSGVGLAPAYPLGTQTQNRNQPILNVTGGSLNSIQITLLQRLTSLFAQESVIGRNIKRYIEQRFGADISNQVYSQVYQLGESTTPIQISDLYSSADTLTATSGSELGSFAGKGIGSGNGKFSVDKVKTDGYFIILQWIEPNSGYFQGMSTELYYTTPEDEARPEFDALGYEATAYGAIADLNDVNATNFDPHATFGFVPRYSGWKNYRNLVNGDLRLRRFGNDMQCFYLDQFRKTYDQTFDTSTNTLKTKYNELPSAGDNWRYYGKNPYLQCFNRIFYNSAEYGDTPYSYNNYSDKTADHVPDNFIIHNIIDIVEHNHLKPMSNSYDTFIDDVNNASKEISQA